jgi:eukaryotic-like serine/threonine-protein kinase
MVQQQQRYRVRQKIASGGMAEVFRAESAGLEGFKKTVAIKRVLPNLAEKKQFIGMFLDEARVSAHLSHSNCVQVFDVGMGDNTFFIVMEYVDGTDLKTVIEYYRRHHSPIPLEEACLITVRICEGLAYAHELRDANGKALNIVHRDMSPPNVLITRYGEVKIVDFGLAKANSQLEKSEPGIIKGKFGYLSPEVALGQVADARTDIFAVGIILWEMLAGKRLFVGNTDLETVHLVQSARIPALQQYHPDVGPELSQVVARALARDPANRYQSARDFGRDLNAILFGAQRPVSSFEIAELVAQPLAQREVDRASRSKDGGSIISSLIEEALFEFVSLGESGVSQAGSAPLGGGFQLGASPSWAAPPGDSPFGLEHGTSRSPSGSPLQVGNLAALEDENIPQSKLLRAVAGAGKGAPITQSSGGASRKSLVLAGAALLVIVGVVVGLFLGRPTKAPAPRQPTPSVQQH